MTIKSINKTNTASKGTAKTISKGTASKGTGTASKAKTISKGTGTGTASKGQVITLEMFSELQGQVKRLAVLVDSQAKAIELCNARDSAFAAIADRFDKILLTVLGTAGQQGTASKGQDTEDTGTGTASKGQDTEDTGDYFAMLDSCVNDLCVRLGQDAKRNPNVTILCDYDLRCMMSGTGRKAIKAYRDANKPTSLTTISVDLIALFERQVGELAQDHQPMTKAAYDAEVAAKKG